MVSVGGWECRRVLGIAETHGVRTRAGLFDVSHIRGEIEIAGNDRAPPPSSHFRPTTLQTRPWASALFPFTTPQGAFENISFF